MPNFCINFLNKAAKLLPTLYDFAVASLADAWIKMGYIIEVERTFCRILHGCVVTCRGIKIVI